MKAWIKSLDYFAVPVSLTQKGKNTYQSMFGGIVTLILAGMLLVSGILTFYQLYKHP